ncbi:SulP family sulfate permease [Acidovorax sp. 69]|uniref:SulP family inorganic anion transporter n=1 Tax=Acidovorax sp. 69 TaxID=2035202 RepID=UPI000C239CBD|nr:sulfate permease [Acidovorax sp. 69]PJI97557.1 SulP family sulfate permease [Acidovorax sp. 69]
MKIWPDWVRTYQKSWFSGDVVAGVIVTVMLIPQSLAYALLAGLPPEVGLYASILPIMAYALLGSSMTLAVGPVAVASLMTASALQPLASTGSADYVALAMLLSLLSGGMLLLFGALRLGFLAHFLSHPVISGFISGSAILIAAGQIKHLLGVKAGGSNVLETLLQLAQAVPRTNGVTLGIGAASVLFLVLARKSLAPWLVRVGATPKLADIASKLAPMLAVVVSTALVAALRWDQTAGVSIVGAVPQGLPGLAWPSVPFSAVGQLWLPALLISLVGFVESVSVAQSLALKRQQRIDPNRELLGLGAANVASALSGGFPVTGGFARSVVNFAAGANTPLAGVISAVLMGVVIAALTSLFHYLPHAVLAATIIVAVVSLIDVQTLREAWRYDKADAMSLLATAGGVVGWGVEVGILMGVALSLGTLVWRSSHPHIAVVGRVPGTEHFRNVARHQVVTEPGLIAVRVDESLYFANSNVLQDTIEALVLAHPETRHVLLVCSAVNQIDATALGTLTDLERSLTQRGIVLLLAEVKGPVLDRLEHTALGQQLQGRVFLSTHEGFVFAHQNAGAQRSRLEAVAASPA